MKMDSVYMEMWVGLFIFCYELDVIYIELNK